MTLPRGLSEVRLNGIERLALHWSVEKRSLNITLPSQYVRDRCLAALDRFSVRDRDDGQRDPGMVTAITGALQRDLQYLKKKM